jgi:hypothetical protein
VPAPTIDAHHILHGVPEELWDAYLSAKQVKPHIEAYQVGFEHHIIRSSPQPQGVNPR